MDQSRHSFLSLLTKIDTGAKDVIRRPYHPPVARVPSFLKPRPQGGWARIGQPVRIRGFNLKEDVLSISLPQDMDMPRLTLETDSENQTVTLRGNGHMLARIYDAPTGITLKHVRVTANAGA